MLLAKIRIVSKRQKGKSDHCHNANPLTLAVESLKFPRCQVDDSWHRREKLLPEANREGRDVETVNDGRPSASAFRDSGGELYSIVLIKWRVNVTLYPNLEKK